MYQQYVVSVYFYRSSDSLISRKVSIGAELLIGNSSSYFLEGQPFKFHEYLQEFVITVINVCPKRIVRI